MLFIEWFIFLKTGLIKKYRPICTLDYIYSYLFYKCCSFSRYINLLHEKHVIFNCIWKLFLISILRKTDYTDIFCYIVKGPYINFVIRRNDFFLIPLIMFLHRLIWSYTNRSRTKFSSQAFLYIRCRVNSIFMYDIFIYLFIYYLSRYYTA